MKTFKLGGVHPEENKISANKGIEVIPLPKQACVPVTQHIGVPSTIMVEKGTIVKVGHLLAKCEGFISANTHSPFSGRVSKIDTVIETTGYRRPAVFIDVEGDEWDETIDRSLDINYKILLSRIEIVDRIKSMGIVGLGGATFPSHIKLMVPEGKKATILIINGAECEPYLTSDHRLMLERGEEIMIGVSILMKALEVNRAVIGIEDNKSDAITYLQSLCSKFKGIEICPLRIKYPQGAEKQLIKAIVSSEVPSGKLPIEVGCVVNNVGTAFAVYEAVQKNKPLIERIVTVTGKSVKNPCNLKVRIGTPVSSLIEYAGGLPEDSGKVIIGGPMMGRAINTLEVPVMKGTSGILVMTRKESERIAVQNCIRCGKCIRVCPMRLEPYKLAQLSEIGSYEISENEKIMDCIECGSCQFTCPAGRPLLDYIRLGKYEVGQIIRNRTKK